MKYLWLAAVAAVLASGPGAQQASPPAATPSEVPAEHPGKVILSRSLEESGQPEKPSTPPAGDPATDAERQAITFLSYDLDVHLQPRQHTMAVRARILLRNDSGSPLGRLPLQISSTLQWTSVRVADAPATFSQQLVTSDIDHTGTLQEAVILLATAALLRNRASPSTLPTRAPPRFLQPGWNRSGPRQMWRKRPIGTGSPTNLWG